MTIQICHVLNAWEAKKPLYGTKNLSKGAKTRVRVLADIQNFALRAHCVRTACALRAWHSQYHNTITLLPNNCILYCPQSILQEQFCKTNQTGLLGFASYPNTRKQQQVTGLVI